MLNILCWNYRGLNKSKKGNLCRDFFQKHHICLVGIQKTKIEAYKDRWLKVLSSSVSN